MPNKLWGGRFSKTTDPKFDKFSGSLRWDVRLLPYDLVVDRAHVNALKRCGVLSAAEAKKLLFAIGTIEKAAKRNALKFKPGSEDIHSAVHAELLRLAGPLADKLQTARSRNDLVSQSSRLYCKEHAGRLIVLIEKFQKAIVAKAEEYQDVLVPGMTHMQNAQVLSQGHIFLAYAEMLDRSRRRMILARALTDVCVLGSGALAGVTFKLDQKAMARELGLSEITRNSYDVSGDRDFVLNMLSSLSFVGQHLSRIAQDLMIGQLKSVGLIDIDQSFCTGSSMMPQKKNADFLELARGSGGVFHGNFVGFLSVVTGMPTSYNRDLQWDKHFLFDSVETAEELLEIFAALFKTLKVNEKRAKELLSDDSLYATDLADYLVGKGVPFKKAHHQVGEIVNFAEDKGIRLSKIGLNILKGFAPAVADDVYRLFDAAHSVNLKKTVGSTHPAQIAKQIRQWKVKLR